MSLSLGGGQDGENIIRSETIRGSAAHVRYIDDKTRDKQTGTWLDISRGDTLIVSLEECCGWNWRAKRSGGRAQRRRMDIVKMTDGGR